MKKFFSVLLVLTMCVNLVSPLGVMASDNIVVCPTEVCTSIINELSMSEQDKASIGMSNVDFSNLYISRKIPVYEYTNNGFTEFSNIYLLLENNEIVTVMYEVEETRYQIMPNLAIDIRQTGATNIALIYDINGCHLYDGLKIITLGNTNMIVEGRADLTEAEELELSKLALVNIAETQKLNYISNTVNTRSQANYMCSVSYVTQLPDDKICWAATLACIVNYVKGTSLTAKQVAKAKNGATDYNHGLYDKTMNSEYNMNYKYHNYKPSDNVMLTNIKNGYPIYGSFTWTNGRHAVTIYGINVLAGCIMIMDPKFGATTSYLSSNGYTYVSSYSGTTLTFDRVGCKTW